MLMIKLENINVIDKVLSHFPQGVELAVEPYGILEATVGSDRILDLLTFLKNDPELVFTFLTDITAVHYPEREKEFTVVYHLHSWTNRLRIRIKAPIGGKHPKIPSATAVWEGANWMERETYDFFGIQFTGHPDLRRILNVDDMEAFPMRKEFPLEDPNRVDKKDYFFGR